MDYWLQETADTRWVTDSLAHITFSFVPPLKVFGLFFFFWVFLPGAAFTVGAYSLEGGGRRHLRRIFGGLGRQQVLRGETNKKVWRVFFPLLPPQRCDRMDVDSTRH